MMLLTKNESQSDLAKELNVSEKFSVLFVVTNKKSIIVSNMTLIQTGLLKELTTKLKLLNELLMAFVISLIFELEFFLYYQIPILQ